MFPIRYDQIVTIALQGLHYTLAFSIYLYGLVYYKRESWTILFRIFPAYLVVNVLVNLLYIMLPEFHLYTSVLDHLLFFAVMTHFTRFTASRIIVFMGISFGLNFTIDTIAILPVSIIQNFIGTLTWNQMLMLAILFTLPINLATLPLQAKIGTRICTATETDLSTALPVAALLIYMPFSFHIFHWLTTKQHYWPNMLLILAATLLLVVFLIQSIRLIMKRMVEESDAFSVQIGKSIAGSYLSNRHDIKNMLSALQYVSHRNLPTENTATPIFQAVLRLKEEAAADLGIALIVNERTAPLEPATDTLQPNLASSQIELSASVLVGILLDNALEHLEKHPGLPRSIVLDFNPNTFELKVANPLDTKSHAHLEKAFQKGHSSKQHDLTSGFGLYNANLIAARMNRRLQYVFDGDLVIFEVV